MTTFCCTQRWRVVFLFDVVHCVAPNDDGQVGRQQWAVGRLDDQFLLPLSIICSMDGNVFLHDRSCVLATKLDPNVASSIEISSATVGVFCLTLDFIDRRLVAEWRKQW